MSAIPTEVLSPEQYLARERKADARSEYYRGEAFAMAGASFEHNLIKENLARQVGNQLEDGPCRVVSSDMRVKVTATTLYTYPDIVIVCDDPRFEDAHVDTLLNPQVVIEVLSDSTERYDRGAKFRHYRTIPSLREFVLVAQDRPLVERYVRTPDETWVLTALDDLSRSIEFASVPVRIALEQIYRGIKLPEDAGR